MHVLHLIYIFRSHALEHPSSNVMTKITKRLDNYIKVTIRNARLSYVHQFFSINVTFNSTTNDAAFSGDR